MGTIRIILVFFLAILQLSHIGAVSPDQTNLGILIDENKKNINFLNVCMSNLAPAQESKPSGEAEGQPAQKNIDHDYYRIIRDINQLDFNGNMWYLQSNYSLAFRQLREAQGRMKEGYELAIQKYLEDTRALLESTAPAIIRSDDNVAKALLRLGFRDLRTGEDRFLMGFNSSPYQYRYKILLYSEGITILRRGKRYAILAMLASKTPDEDKAEYQYWSLDDLKEAREEPKEPNYDKVKNNLSNYVDNKRLERKVVPPANPQATPLDLFEQHDDNYGMITENRLDLIMEANFEIKETDSIDREKVPPIPKFNTDGTPKYE
ncbi:adhesin OmpL37 family surface protein [Leptospira sp. GIMC2001]|uniref:adhesin OmpL37 family surface protein n=1 Tax=Leptospira sp. GIMC2001 TaxID=1513297 RepID=UPI0023495802|nr:AraC family transcriptional regulator [Leptospira sp. GIMC2001]WCL50860.1 AraC family transcriptional regulator [Leptospira sp. GIMC2001]